MGNFIKATYAALALTYGYLTPDLWKKQGKRLVCTSAPFFLIESVVTAIPRHPFAEFSQVFESTKKGAVQSLK